MAEQTWICTCCGRTFADDQRGGLSRERCLVCGGAMLRQYPIRKPAPLGRPVDVEGQA